jgi:hypothetical protein
VEQQTGQELGRIERRSRTLTGLVLGALAFGASYGLMLYEGQIERPAFLFYPWLLGALFYFAGDLLAMIWFRSVTAQLTALLEQQHKDEEVRRMAELKAALESAESPMPEGVEVIRPGGR